MKITAIKAWQVDLPLKEGRYSWSNGNFVEVFDATVVAVETDAGITGYAECCPLGSAYLPAYAAGVRAGLAEIGPEAASASTRSTSACSTGAWTPCCAATRTSKAPVDVACWDILGKVAGLPVYKLLGGSEQTDIALYRAISQQPPDEMARNIAGYRNEGYRKFQLKVGADANDDIARIRACRRDARTRRRPGRRCQHRMDDARGRACGRRGPRRRRLHRAAVPVVRGMPVHPAPHRPAVRAGRGDHRRRRAGARARRRRDGRDQPQDLQGRRPHQGAADARSLRRGRDSDDHRGHLGRRHRHGGHRPSRALDAGRVLLLGDGFQQLRHGHDRRRRAAARRRQDDGAPIAPASASSRASTSSAIPCSSSATDPATRRAAPFARPRSFMS